MSKLDFIKKLYNGKNCYSDHMNEDELGFLHIPSGVEQLVSDMLDKHKLVFLTGNPGDGKTYIIKAIEACITRNNAFVETDFNEVTRYDEVARAIVDLYKETRPAVLAINEYMPNHIILKPKNGELPVLTLDADFLRTLDAVENGYPVGLLAPQYEQAAAMFLQQLDNYGYAEENDDGEIILASRTNSSKKTVLIQDGKYDFEEGEE